MNFNQSLDITLDRPVVKSGYVRVNGTELYYEDTGGPGEPIIFSHGLLFSTSQFEPQVAALRHRYRCISYDHRGQGKSADVNMRVIDMDTLCDDAIALIETLQLGAVHFCGLSMGGFVGMRLAIKRPELVRSLILCATSADPEPDSNQFKYRLLSFLARWLGTRCVAPAVAPMVYGKTAINNPLRQDEKKEWIAALGRNRRSIWRAVNGVVDRLGIYNELSKIVAPTIIFVGDEDTATVPAKSRRLAQAIRNAQLLQIPHAGHTVTIEEPAAVNSALIPFLAAVQTGATSKTRAISSP